MLLKSNTEHHHIYSSDLAQCDELEQVYTCPKEILDRPLDNVCFQAHLANNIDAIQLACVLKKSQAMNTVIPLQGGILYFDLPEDSKITRHCESFMELPLEGKGIITIPSGCAITHKMKTFVNTLKRKAVQTQQILLIPEEELTMLTVSSTELEIRLGQWH